MYTYSWNSLLKIYNSKLNCTPKKKRWGDWILVILSNKTTAKQGRSKMWRRVNSWSISTLENNWIRRAKDGLVPWKFHYCFIKNSSSVSVCSFTEIHGRMKVLRNFPLSNCRIRKCMMSRNPTKIHVMEETHFIFIPRHDHPEF